MTQLYIVNLILINDNNNISFLKEIRFLNVAKPLLKTDVTIMWVRFQIRIQKFSPSLSPQ